MRKNNRKGFTIVELVIVIAVIAILAGVLIPTFSGIVKKAQASAALQEAQNAYKEAYAIAIANDGVINEDDNTDDITDEVKGIKVSNFGFTVSVGDDGTVSWDVTEPNDFGYKVEITGGANGKVKVTEE